jgi:hypothetical protein
MLEIIAKKALAALIHVMLAIVHDRQVDTLALG